MQRRRLLCLLAMILCPFSFARGDDAAERLVLATYKLANENSTASGIVICDDSVEGASHCFVVTAHHVLDQMKGDACVLVSRKRNQDQTYERVEISVPIRESGKPLWHKHARQDLAILPLSSEVHVEALPLDSLVNEEQLAEVRVGDDVRLAVFPERMEANNAGFAIVRSGSIASFPLLPIDRHPIFLVDTTSWTGDSGGPVIHSSLRSPSGGPMVIGIVQGMRNVTDVTKESRFVERRTHYPLAVSEIVHASLVRELIAQHRDHP